MGPVASLRSLHTLLTSPDTCLGIARFHECSLISISDWLLRSEKIVYASLMRHCVSKTCIITWSWQYHNCLLSSSTWVISGSQSHLCMKYSGQSFDHAEAGRYTNDQMRREVWVLFRHTRLPSRPRKWDFRFRGRCLVVGMKGTKITPVISLQSRPFAFARTWLKLHTSFSGLDSDCCPCIGFQPAGPGPEVNWEGVMV